MAGWLGPWNFPRGWSAAWLDGFRSLEAWLAPWPRWLGLGLLLGAVPVLADYALQTRLNHPLTALAALPLLLASVSRDRAHPGLTCVVLTYLVHAAVVITLAYHDPGRLAVALPDGEAYWRETVTWLRTGEPGVYEAGNWVPYHFGLAAVVPVLSYLTLGFLPLVQGLFQTDLMNFYVGQYLAHAKGPGAGMLFAWHPWSVCRGVGMLFLVYEFTSLSLARLTGQRLSTPGRRWTRVGLGVGFLLLDGVIKWSGSEAVRRVLSAGLE
jgi:hypothetical protein